MALSLSSFYIYINNGDCLDILNSIVSILTVASCLSAAFNYVVIRPINISIWLNSDVLNELKREIEMNMLDRCATVTDYN